MSDERKRAALDALAMLAAQRDEVEREITAAVAHAHNMGATWTQIETATGLQRGTGPRRYLRLPLRSAASTSFGRRGY